MMRKLADEELAQIALQSAYFNGVGSSVPRAAAKAAPVPGVSDGTRSKKTKTTVKAKAKANGKRAPRATKEQQTEFLEKVYAAIKDNSGLASSEIGQKVGIEGSRLVTALRQLKADKRIFQGGKLRFSRYATTQKAADTASAKAKKAKA